MKTYIYKAVKPFSVEKKIGGMVMSKDVEVGEFVFSNRDTDREIKKLLEEGKIEFYKLDEE